MNLNWLWLIVPGSMLLGIFVTLLVLHRSMRS